MLDWLKTILGEAYTDEIDKKVSDEIGKGFVSKADFNTTNEAKKALDAQLKEASKTIDGFKELDIEAIKKSAEDYKQKAEQAEKDAAAQIAASKRDQLYEGIANSSELKFTSDSAKTAFLAAMKTKEFPVEDGKLLGYNDFLDGYKKQDPGAFAGTTPAPAIVLPGGDDKSADKADTAKVRAIMGLPPEKD